MEQTTSRTKRVLLVIASVMVVGGTLGKVGLRLYKASKGPSAPVFEIYAEGRERSFPIVGDPSKKVWTAAKPMFELKDFDDVLVAPVQAQPDLSQAPATYHAVLLRPRPEAKTKIEVNAEAKVFMVSYGQMGGTDSVPLGDMKIDGNILMVLTPDEGTAKQIRATTAEAMKK